MGLLRDLADLPVQPFEISDHFLGQFHIVTVDQDQSPAEVGIDRPVRGDLMLLGRHAITKLIALRDQLLNGRGTRHSGILDRLIRREIHGLGLG